MTALFSKAEGKRPSSIDFRIMRKEERATFFEFLNKVGWLQVDQPFEFDMNWSHSKIRKAARDNAAQLYADLLIETEDEAFSSSPFNNLVYYAWRRTPESLPLPPGYTVPPLMLMQQLIQHHEQMKRTKQYQHPAPGQLPGQPPAQPPAQAPPKRPPQQAPQPGQAPKPQPPQQPPQQQQVRPPQQQAAPGQLPGQPPAQQPAQVPPKRPPQQAPQPGQPPKPQAPQQPPLQQQVRPPQQQPQPGAAPAPVQAPGAPTQAPPVPCPKCKQPMALLPNGQKQCRACGTIV